MATTSIQLFPLRNISQPPSSTSYRCWLQAIKVVCMYRNVIGLALFAFPGALGQPFIFETLQHFRTEFAAASSAEWNRFG
ncbi:hypothetical protein CYLTODRAFT_423089 [Cylindrobasidium torrendii FP15055 ss-10]|uniref:Uncharacterized protein n=1 Tax=Cylindrobasidium torrendii FP15055 ss-10 TaxID=1314674 RepID=A0A0D7B8E5_9AGAR|nr:hypothetical protein CYLTODRAFT_423089 [Cylindrobasidium torrendii FP15055 ss-10]